MIKVKYFKNNTCGVCIAFIPKMERIANDFKLELEIIDVKENPEIAGQNMVFTIPTTIFYNKDGKMKRFARNFLGFKIRAYIERIYDILYDILNVK